MVIVVIFQGGTPAVLFRRRKTGNLILLAGKLHGISILAVALKDSHELHI